MGAELAPIIRGVLEAQKEQTELAQANARLGEELARTTAELGVAQRAAAVQRVRCGGSPLRSSRRSGGRPAWTRPGARLPPMPNRKAQARCPANAQAEHARRAGEQATQLKVDLAVAQQQVASLGAECAQWQRMHAAEARRARQLEEELRHVTHAGAQPPSQQLVVPPPEPEPPAAKHVLHYESAGHAQGVSQAPPPYREPGTKGGQ